ncbi:hypothetical protein CWO05_16510 [Vibrio splendidus]|nr:hypothetical protein CWO05_16510 [Vibrio splendidus]PTP99963.1 hypothetical protein CWO34_07250 [Vibrio splendidus]
MAVQLEFGIVVEIKANEKPKRKINRLWLHLVARTYSKNARALVKLDQFECSSSTCSAFW